MRRLRLLIYESGDPVWIKPHPNEFIKPGRPYICGKGSVHSMEVTLTADLDAALLKLFADEVVKLETRKPEDEDGN